MEFRHPSAVSDCNNRTAKYLTESLADKAIGLDAFQTLIKELGNAVESYPDWHPILTIPNTRSGEHSSSLHEFKVYEGHDHTRLFVKGFVTCPYSEETANDLVEHVNSIEGLHAYRLHTPLYSDHAHPVVVRAYDIELEADGTIRSRDAIYWCVNYLVKGARKAQCAETWETMRGYLLGSPHGSRSSLFVNQYAGGHMRKILDSLNNSGIFGPIKEWSLDSLSEKKRKSISNNLIRASLNCWDKTSSVFTFELRGETCNASIRDTFDDGEELSIKVTIGDFDLLVTGFYYPNTDLVQTTDPKGKLALAKKFI